MSNQNEKTNNRNTNNHYNKVSSTKTQSSYKTTNNLVVRIEKVIKDRDVFKALYLEEKKLRTYLQKKYYVSLVVNFIFLATIIGFFAHMIISQ